MRIARSGQACAVGGGGLRPRCGGREGAAADFGLGAKAMTWLKACDLFPATWSARAVLRSALGGLLPRQLHDAFGCGRLKRFLGCLMKSLVKIIGEGAAGQVRA